MKSVRALGRALREMRPWFWVAVVVVVSAVFRFQLSRDSPAPWIFVDELIYSELAKSLAAGGQLVRDVPVSGYGVVYPLLISPAWLLFDRIPDAYAAAKAINAVLISLAAVPAYLLARRVVGQSLALVAAVLAVALPSLAYSGVLMTENAFYPLFLVVVLVLVLVLERPTLTRQIVLACLLGIAFLTRPQAVALMAAALTAPLVQGVLGRRVRASLRAQWALYAIIGSALLVVGAVQLARGQSLTSLLGAYAVVGERGYEPGAVARYFLYHAAELDLYVGVAPVAAAVLLVVVAGRSRDARLDAYVAASISVAFWLLLVVSAFASRFAERLQERNVFYLAPLILIMLLAWIERGAPRPARATAVAAIVAAALPGVLPFPRLIAVPALSETLMLLPLWRLVDAGLPVDALSAVVVPAAIAVAALLIFLPRRLALVLPLLVLVYFLVALRPIEQRMTSASQGSFRSGIGNVQRDWIDRAVPAGAKVAVLWTGQGDVYPVWQNEFFNRSVGTIYHLGKPLLGNLPQTRLDVDAQAGLLRGRDGRPVQPRYLLVNDTFTPAGRVLARDAVHRVALYRLEGPLRSTWKVTGLYPGDTWSGAGVTYTRYDCTGGILRTYLRGDPSLFTEPTTVTARIQGAVAGRVTFEPAEEIVLPVALVPRAGQCVVEFSVNPTGVPAELTHGANPDSRVLGAHFDRFEYEPPR